MFGLCFQRGLYLCEFEEGGDLMKLEVGWKHMKSKRLAPLSSHLSFSLQPVWPETEDDSHTMLTN